MLSKELVFAEVIKEWSTLQRMCNYDHDCFGFAVLDRVESIARNFNGQSALRTYLFNTVRWYARKYTITLPAYRLAHGTFEHSLEQDVPYTPTHTTLEVEDSLNALEPEESEVLREHYLQGETLEDMARARGITVVKLISMIRSALRNME